MLIWGAIHIQACLHVYSKSKVHLTMWHSSREREREIKTSQTKQDSKTSLQLKEVVLVCLSSGRSRRSSTCIYVSEVWFQQEPFRPVGQSCACRAEGLSEGRWLVLLGRCEWRRGGCCSSASNPTWSHHSAGVYQAKAVWSLNARAANLFNYSPSATACLMRTMHR